MQAESQGAADRGDMGWMGGKKSWTRNVLGDMEQVGVQGIFNGSWRVGDGQASKPEMGRQRELVGQAGW